jgi:hypothetical protein
VRDAVVASDWPSADEDLHPGRWFRDETISGGFLLEHGRIHPLSLREAP